jgi:hypothetical protein
MSSIVIARPLMSFYCSCGGDVVGIDAARALVREILERYGESYHVACGSYAAMRWRKFETSRRARIEFFSIAVLKVPICSRSCDAKVSNRNEGLKCFSFER